MTKQVSCTLAVAALLLAGAVAHAADLVTLSPENYEQYAPEGKEVEAIFGDYVLRNDKIVVVVGNPVLISGRSSGRWGKPSVKGAVIDLTLRGAQNDHLNAYYAAPVMYRPDAPQKQADFVDEALAWKEPGREPASGKRVTLRVPPYEQDSGKTLADLAALPPSRRPKPRTYVELSYTLEDGWDYVLVEAVYKNPTNKPAPRKLNTMLRVDGAWEMGTDLDARLFWVYNKWWGQAYGVLAEDHLITRAEGYGRHEQVLALPAGGKTTVTLAPGKEFRMVRRLIPGSNLFEVKAVARDILGVAQRTVRLTVTDPDGPVADADVTAAVGGRAYAAGRTDAKGELRFRIPKERCELRVETMGRRAKVVALDPGAGEKAGVTLDAASCVVAQITDGKGGPTPCKVEFRGTDGTPDPFFFPDSGEHLVRNLVYTHTGRFRQAVPPGNYWIVVTRGPEYEAVLRKVEVKAGAETQLKETLRRTVETPGWIAADFHNHSTVTAETNHFYVYPYNWNPSVDGDSHASQLGRVLNLLCDGIEFAPPTEHNTVSSYAPHLKALGAEHLLATCPGVGMTAGRRHTVTHQNAFPVIHKPGKQDGGALQRPEHIGQLQWLMKWDEGGDKLIQINVPLGDNLAVQRGMEVLDVRDLEPIVGLKPIKGRDNRILEWLELLRLGYRLPGVIGSGTFTNYHGSGGVRCYVKSPTDDPAKVQPLDVVREVRKGHVIMTTGPFLDVALRCRAGGKEVVGIPGDDVASTDGKATLEVGVRCPNWIQVDTVEVLLSGRPSDPPLRFERKKSEADQKEWREQIPLALKQDAFVIVVASGQGTNLRGPKGPEDAVQTHVAVSNPIYVDVGGNGFKPHSPLDDKTEGYIAWRRVPLAKPGAEPGQLRVTVRNRGTQEAHDVIALSPNPENCITVLGDKQREYTVAAGGEATMDFDVVLSDEWLARGLPAVTYSYIFRQNPTIRVNRSSVGQGRKAGSIRLLAHHHAAHLPPIKSVGQVATTLAQELVYPLKRRNTKLADLRFALAGEDLAVHFVVSDTALRQDKVVLEGSCVEVFGAMPKQKPIGQVFLVPQVGGSSARALQQVKGHVEPAPGVRLATKATPTGYELQALIPLALLPVEPGEETILLEFRAHAHVAGGRLMRATVFQSGAPDRDHLQFGTIRIADKVRVRLDALRPPVAKAGAEPARVRVTLKNRTGTQAQDEVSLDARPKGSVRTVGAPRVPYKLAAGEEKAVEFRMALADGFAGNAVEFYVPPSAHYEIARSPSLKVAVLADGAGRLKPLAALDDVAGALAGRRSYVVAGQDGKPLAQLRFAIAGDALALDAQVADKKVTRGRRLWDGSCVEAFGSLPGTTRIGQVFLVPKTAAKPAAVFGVAKGGQVPAAQAKVRTTPNAKGYAMQALIPLSLLALEETQDRFLVEFQVTVTQSVDAGGRAKVSRGTLFGSTRAYNDNSKYALVMMLDE